MATLEQLADQNSHIGQAMYDLVKACEAFAVGKPQDGAAALQDAKTHINALDPARFDFSPKT